MALRIERVQAANLADVSPEAKEIILRLHKRYFDGTGRPNVKKVWWWLAWDGDKPVGFAALKPQGKGHYVLWRVAVDPAYRRRGLGRQFIEARLAWAKHLTPGPRVITTYLATWNLPSLNNLIRYGFLVTKATPRGVAKKWMYLRLETH